MRRKSISILVVLLMLTGCSDALHRARKDGAAAEIAISKGIKGLRTLSDTKTISLQEEDAGLEFLQKVNDPLLSVGKRLQGVNTASWSMVKGDVLAQLDVVLAGLNESAPVVFKSESARAQFQVWVSAIRAAVLTFRASLEAIRNV